MWRCQWTRGVFLLGLRDIKSHRVSALRMLYHSWQSWSCNEVKQGDMGSSQSNAVLRVAKKMEVIVSAVTKMTY
jgi:hypothetical protein